MCLDIWYAYSSQVWQFHRRFDECQPYHLNTDLIQLHTVWSVSRRCTQWNNSLSVLSRQSITVQIRHCSVTIHWLLHRVWNWSACKRYESVEYQYSDIYHSNKQLFNAVVSTTRRRTPSDYLIKSIGLWWCLADLNNNGWNYAMK